MEFALFLYQGIAIVIGTRAGEDRLRHGFAWGFVLLLFLGVHRDLQGFLYYIIYYYLISLYLFGEFRGLKRLMVLNTQSFLFQVPLKHMPPMQYETEW